MKKTVTLLMMILLHLHAWGTEYGSTITIKGGDGISMLASQNGEKPFLFNPGAFKWDNARSRLRIYPSMPPTQFSLVLGLVADTDHPLCSIYVRHWSTNSGFSWTQHGCIKTSEQCWVSPVANAAGKPVLYQYNIWLKNTPRPASAVHELGHVDGCGAP